jgi:hypothetical protein
MLGPSGLAFLIGESSSSVRRQIAHGGACDGWRDDVLFTSAPNRRRAGLDYGLRLTVCGTAVLDLVRKEGGKEGAGEGWRTAVTVAAQW